MGRRTVESGCGDETHCIGSAVTGRRQEFGLGICPSIWTWFIVWGRGEVQFEYILHGRFPFRHALKIPAAFGKHTCMVFVKGVLRA